MEHLYIPLLIVYLVIINVLGFILMHADKKKSQKKRRRVPERVLLGTAIIGGSIGIMAGMEIFRHKTKHKRFSIGVPVILVLQLALVIIFYFILREPPVPPA